MDCIVFLELYHRVGKGHLLPKWNEKEREAVAKYGLAFTKPMKNFNQMQWPPAQPSSANLLAHRQLSKPQRQCDTMYDTNHLPNCLISGFHQNSFPSSKAHC